MPQGFRKPKNNLPTGVKTKNKKEKKIGLKKGKFDIASKKTKIIEDKKLSKKITGIVHNKVEADVIRQTTVVEAKALNIKNKPDCSKNQSSNKNKKKTA